MQYKLVALWVVLVLSIGLNTYLLLQFNDLQKRLSEVGQVCPPGMICKDFSWVDEYVEVIGKKVEWIDCGEGVNNCARWEDYSGRNPLPEVLVKECPQQGTRLEEGVWVTGLPEGAHTMVGATIRPCEDIAEDAGIIEVDYLGE